MVEKILTPIPEKGTDHIKFIPALAKDKNVRNYKNMSPAQNSLSSFLITLRALEFTPL